MANLDLADRLASVPQSLITTIAQMVKPDTISFSNGNPGAETFPVEKFADATRDFYIMGQAPALRYGASKGYEPLRESQKAYLAQRWGFDFVSANNKNDVVITVGGQQAVDIAAKMLVRPGSVVITEDRTFDTCMFNFLTYEAKVRGVTMQEDGMDLAELESVLQENKLADGSNNVSAIYTIPTFQNPSGYTTTNAKRQAIYALAVQYKVPIIEDDPYCELRIQGSDQIPYKAMDTENIVFYAGSWSKTLAPALRCGYLVYPDTEEYARRLEVAIQVTTIHPTLSAQYVVNSCIDAQNNFTYFKNHVKYCQNLYSLKRDVMLISLAFGQTPPDLTHNVPEGGLFMSLQFRPNFDTLQFTYDLLEAENVAIIPGAAFYADQSISRNWARLCYAGPTPDLITTGMERLLNFYKANGAKAKYDLN